MWHTGVRSYVRLTADLTWVSLSAFIALFVRDNFVLSFLRFEGIVPYALLCVVVAAIVFAVAGFHRALWRYTSLLDILRLAGAVTATLLLALSVGFALNRLEDVARSLPIIQLLFLIAATASTRIAVRLIGERKEHRHKRSGEASPTLTQVLIIGVNNVTELYLRSIAEFAPADFAVAGILTPRRALHGRFLRQNKILGSPEDVMKVLAELELHGVAVNRIAVAQPLERLSNGAREALLLIERSSTIKVDWLVEKSWLAWRGHAGSSGCF